MDASTRVTWVGSAANLGLSALKFAAGILGNSSALVADAAHSLSDFGSDIVVLAGLKISSKPKDESHQYGHGKVETTAAVTVGLMLAGAGFYLFWYGVSSLYQDRYTNPGSLALAAALVSIVVKEILYRVTDRIGRRERKASVIANAWHHRSDALSSVAAFVGVGGNMLGVSHLDLVASVAVSLFVIRAGVMITWNAYKDLVDTAVEDHLLDSIKRIIETSSGVMGFHKLRTRKVGGAVLVDLHLLVRGSMTVKESHDIADRIEHRLMDELDVHDVTIHVEAYRCERPEECTFDECEMIDG